jgi:hypothetical protein
MQKQKTQTNKQKKKTKINQDALALAQTFVTQREQQKEQKKIDETLQKIKERFQEQQKKKEETTRKREKTKAEREAMIQRRIKIYNKAIITPKEKRGEKTGWQIALEKLDAARPKSELEKKIAKQGRNQITQLTELGTTTTKIGDKRPQYIKLMKGKIEDKEALNRILAQKQKMVKKRIICEVRLWTKEGLAGRITLQGLLLEEEANIDAELLGKKKEYGQGLALLAKDLKKATKAQRVDVRDYTKDGTIEKIEKTWSFA